MRGFVARVRDWLRAVGAPPGRHRAVKGGGRRRVGCPSGTSAGSLAEGPAIPRAPGRASVRRTIAPTVRHWHARIDGESSPLVRPYVASVEQEEKARIQRLRRDILWCATYGVDLDLRDIHGWTGVTS